MRTSISVLSTTSVSAAAPTPNNDADQATRRFARAMTMTSVVEEDGDEGNGDDEGNDGGLQLRSF